MQQRCPPGQRDKTKLLKFERIGLASSLTKKKPIFGWDRRELTGGGEEQERDGGLLRDEGAGTINWKRRRWIS